MRLEGGALRAGATDGRRGAVLIDPDDIEVVGSNQYTDGADYTLIANDSITVSENVTISTRDPPTSPAATTWPTPRRATPAICR